jgi:transcriptional regulator with XRE-family HTH domain
MDAVGLKSWRECLGLSQKAAADALGISKSSIELYERGTRRDDGRPVSIPTTVALACKYLEQEARLRHQLDMLQSGKMTTRGEKGGMMVDTTAETIAQVRTWIADMSSALAETRKWYSPMI